MPSITIPAWLAARNPESRVAANPKSLTRDAGATWEEVMAAVKAHRGLFFRVKDCVGVAMPKRRILAMLKEARASGVVETLRATSVLGKQADGRAFAFEADVRGWPTVVWIHLDEKKRQRTTARAGKPARRRKKG